jgi:hypothetical protein
MHFGSAVWRVWMVVTSTMPLCLELAGCEQPGLVQAPASTDVGIAPGPLEEVPEPAWTRQALDLVWRQALQEPTDPRAIHWARQPGSCCGFSDGCAFGNDEMCVYLPPDGTFPKDVFVHELLHLWTFRHGVADIPWHTNTIWQLYPQLVDALNQAGIPGVGEGGQRTNLCGKSLQECCTYGPECEPGLSCLAFAPGRYLCVAPTPP